MTTTQKIIKYFAVAIAVFLIFMIASGILSALGIISGAFAFYNKIDEDVTELNLNNDANVLDIDLKSTNLIILTGEKLDAQTNNENIRIEKENNKLIIKEKKHSIFEQTNNTELTIYIPEDYLFDAVSINAGAGKIDINKLIVNNLFFDLGAGNVTIEKLYVNKEAEIDGGAGKLGINNGKISNLNLDLGVGNVNLWATLLGDSNIQTGIGSTNITVLGNKEDYEIEVDKGIGEVKVDGIKVKDEYTYGRGYNSIDIDGGIGNINLMFK